MSHPPSLRECQLAAFVLQHGNNERYGHGHIPQEFWQDVDKQLTYYLEKWSDRGWWNYGVTTRSGWVEEKGIEPLCTLAMRYQEYTAASHLMVCDHEWEPLIPGLANFEQDWRCKKCEIECDPWGVVIAPSFLPFPLC